MTPLDKLYAYCDKVNELMAKVSCKEEHIDWVASTLRMSPDVEVSYDFYPDTGMATFFLYPSWVYKNKGLLKLLPVTVIFPKGLPISAEHLDKLQNW